eukprot:Plantae.Rhodophyta-Purpureofilum_apyrenoidigerum.ctg17642.p1 GENE.Plantae.Rhodophyta-Purpureofilum_apyrenoidigerum.ctg17642~~Plantae.Rhodophyta-Purpureofilum_apyrenoidigerum.ctg17642.p1  ORF type:complete len:340 (-),score=55.80 Plantae.Rhodophyta-Purpureofilum_apyrenoidigerum.ctg17642:349-1368(-)
MEEQFELRAWRSFRLSKRKVAMLGEDCSDRLDSKQAADDRFLCAGDKLTRKASKGSQRTRFRPGRGDSDVHSFLSVRLTSGIRDDDRELSRALEPSDYLKTNQPPLRLISVGTNKARDLLALAHNALRTEVDTLFRICNSLESQANYLIPIDMERFGRWTSKFSGFVQKFFDYENRELFPLLEQSPKGPLNGHLSVRKRRLVRESVKHQLREIEDWTSRAQSAPTDELSEYFKLLRCPVDKLGLILFGYLDREVMTLPSEFNIRCTKEQLKEFPHKTFRAFARNPEKKLHTTLLLGWLSTSEEAWLRESCSVAKPALVRKWQRNCEHMILAKSLIVDVN